MVAVGQQARAGAERILELLDSNPLVAETPDARRPRRRSRGEVAFDDVTLRLPALGAGARRLLAARSRRARPSRSSARRARASRRSRLLLPRFYDVQDGAIRIDGVDVRDVTLDSLRRADRRRVRGQLPLLRHRAGQHRVRAARRDRRRGRAPRPAPPRPHEFIAGAPRRATTPSSASAASRSRAASASASRSPGRCITDPRVLVLDDATSSVDAATEEEIHATLREIMAGRTTILDRPPPLDAAPRRPHRAWSTTAASSTSGTHEELLARRRCYRALLAGPGDDARERRRRRSTASRRRRRGRRGVDAPRSATATPRTRDGAAPVGAPSGARRGAGGGARRAAAAAGGGGRGGGGLALAPTPELLAAVDALPPADDDPDVDVAAEAAGREPRSGSRRVPAAVPPAAARSASRSSCSTRSLTLAGPFLVRSGIDRGRAAPGATGALWVASALFLVVDAARLVRDVGATRAYTGRTAERLLFALRIRIFAHLQRLVARLLRPRDGGPDHDPHDHRRRRARAAAADRAHHRARQHR